MAGKIEVDGLRELRAALRAAEGRSTRELSKANKRAVEEAIRPPVRAGAPERSGRLRKSVRGMSSSTAAVLAVGSPSVPYAGPINFGWPRRNIRAQEFIYKGIVKGENKMLDIYLEHVDNIAKPIAPEGKF